ncbi:hypothetical protein MRX96_012441 [Rhipicephalus microplus]
MCGRGGVGGVEYPFWLRPCLLASVATWSSPCTDCPIKGSEPPQRPVTARFVWLCINQTSDAGARECVGLPALKAMPIDSIGNTPNAVFSLLIMSTWTSSAHCHLAMDKDLPADLRGQVHPLGGSHPYH